MPDAGSTLSHTIHTQSATLVERLSFCKARPRMGVVVKLDPVILHPSTPGSTTGWTLADAWPSASHQHANNPCEWTLAVCTCRRCRTCSLAPVGKALVFCNGVWMHGLFSRAHRDQCTFSCTFHLHPRGRLSSCDSQRWHLPALHTRKQPQSFLFLFDSSYILVRLSSSSLSSFSAIHSFHLFLVGSCMGLDHAGSYNCRFGLGVIRHVHAHVQLPQVSTRDARMDEILS